MNILIYFKKTCVVVFVASSVFLCIETILSEPLNITSVTCVAPMLLKLPCLQKKKTYLGDLESMSGCSDRTGSGQSGLLLSTTVLEWRRREAHLLYCQTACAAVELTLRTCTFSNIQISTKHKNGCQQCYIGTTWGKHAYAHFYI